MSRWLPLLKVCSLFIGMALVILALVWYLMPSPTPQTVADKTGDVVSDTIIQPYESNLTDADEIAISTELMIPRDDFVAWRDENRYFVAVKGQEIGYIMTIRTESYESDVDEGMSVSWFEYDTEQVDKDTLRRYRP